MGWDPPSESGGGGAGVSSFNSRTGAVTLSAADLAEAVTPGTSGNVLTSNGTTWTSAAAGSSAVTSYNSRTGAVVPLVADLVAAVAPGTAGNVLTSSAGSWVSAAPSGGVSSYNSRTGAVVPIAADLAAAVAPGTAGNVLTSAGGAWTSAAPAAAGVSSYNSRTGAVVPTAADLATAVAPGTNGNVLTASGGAWTSAAPSGGGVSSFNSRTGAVTPGNADYLAVASGGLTGAVAATRFVGGTASGHPTTGTFAVGDFVIDQTGVVWICTVAGTPGTWVNPSSASGVSSFNSRTGAVVPASADYTVGQVTGAAPIASPTFTGTTTAPEYSASGLTGATAASRYVGATASAAPTSGTFAVGDFVIDQTGKVWVCTTAGTPGTWTNAGSSSGVSSFNSRTGAVTPTTGDYTAAQVTNAADKSSASEQAFTGVVGSAAGFSTEVIAGGPLAAAPATIITGAAVPLGTGGAIPQQLSTTRDMHMSLTVQQTTGTTTTNATLQMCPTNSGTAGNWSTVAHCGDSSTTTGTVKWGLHVLVPKGWYIGWFAFTNVTIVDSAVW